MDLANRFVLSPKGSSGTLWVHLVWEGKNSDYPATLPDVSNRNLVARDSVPVSRFRFHMKSISNAPLPFRCALSNVRERKITLGNFQQTFKRISYTAVISNALVLDPT